MKQRIAQSHLATVPRAFTLMEALIASSILLVAVVAVSSALSAGQQHAFEAQQRIAANLAAEDLMARILCEDYALLFTWDDYEEHVGAMTRMGGGPMPETFLSLGRAVDVAASIEELAELGIYVAGQSITIRVFDQYDRELANITRFVPEPN